MLNKDLPSHYPKPVGYRILIRLAGTIESETRTRGGVIVPVSVKDTDRSCATVGEVLAMGPLCYTKEDQGDPWCKVGDWVVFAKFNGQRFAVQDADGKKEIRLLNDDDIQAVVSNPEAILPPI